MLVTCLSAVSLLAQTESETVYATRGEPFEMTGFVLGYQGGNCTAPNFTYLLDSTDHRNKFWLCATGANEAALHRAMLSRGIYSVTGTLQLGAERPYVEVESVQWY
jgi:hypothetical protein